MYFQVVQKMIGAKAQDRRKPFWFSRFCNAGDSRFLNDPKDINPAAKSRVKAFAPCTKGGVDFQDAET
ncbi:hypothetical protein OA90_08220 [Labrenzia sp. OB1]|nr:hypothetical protein OA90_08220 [Labrenzia sp. OB1]